MNLKSIKSGVLLVSSVVLTYSQTPEEVIGRFLQMDANVKTLNTEVDTLTKSLEENRGVVFQTKENLENLKGQVDGLNESYLETKTTVDKLAKIKISGYTQVQAVYALDTGIQSSTNTLQQGKFEVRRGRLKVNYDNGKMGQYVMQFQFNEEGARTLDMYANISDPWLNIFSIQAGVQNIPFGYEIAHSSSVRETLERSLFAASIFRGERELGFLLSVNPITGVWSNFNFQIGAFNHNGVGVENDDNKPIIGRLGFKSALYDLGLGIDGGFSFLTGSSQSRSDSVFHYDSKDTLKILDRGNLNKDLSKYILGFDLQAYYDIIGLGGAILRTEYTFGKWVSNSEDNRLYSGSKSPYIRHVMGYYVTYVQNIGEKFQTVVRWEEFDPNTELEGSEIGKKTKSSKQDIRRSQLGGGVNYFLNENIKLSLYYDHPINEKSSNLSDNTKAYNNYAKEIKDDVVTFRFQYKF